MARPVTASSALVMSMPPTSIRPLLGATIKPKLGLRPEPFAKAAYQFWLGGDFIKNDEPQGNQGIDGPHRQPRSHHLKIGGQIHGRIASLIRLAPRL